MSDLDLAADLLDPPQTGALLYHDDPAGFVRNCIKWKPGEEPAPYQLRNLEKLVENERIVVRSPRRAGKTATNTWAILWFSLTRDAAGEDWIAIATAGVFRQLKAFLWGQLMTKWTPRLRWDRIGRKPFTALELMREELRLTHGSVLLAATTDPAKMEGAHADQVFFLFDEAKAIPDGIFNSVEGTFAGAGADTHASAYVLVSSTPGPREGRFHDLSQGVRGYTSYESIHVTLEEVLAAGQLSAERITEYAERYGVESVWYQNHVLGEFADADTDSVIPLHWLEACERRWQELGLTNPSSETLAIPQHPNLGLLGALGVDLGFGGEDRSVYALRHGDVISTLVWRPREKNPEVPAREITALLKSVEGNPRAIVDTGSAGLGVYHELRKQHVRVEGFLASEGVPGRTREGIYEYENKRAAGWWNLREAMDPLSGRELAIPPDERLRGDLLAPRWKANSRGRIVIESKDDIRKRLKRSTDAGDSVVHAFFTGTITPAAPRPLRRPGGSRWAPLGLRAGREGTLGVPQAMDVDRGQIGSAAVTAPSTVGGSRFRIPRRSR